MSKIPLYFFFFFLFSLHFSFFFFFFPSPFFSSPYPNGLHPSLSLGHPLPPSIHLSLLSERPPSISLSLGRSRRPAARRLRACASPRASSRALRLPGSLLPSRASPSRPCSPAVRPPPPLCLPRSRPPRSSPASVLLRRRDWGGDRQTPAARWRSTTTASRGTASSNCRCRAFHEDKDGKVEEEAGGSHIFWLALSGVSRRMASPRLLGASCFSEHRLARLHQKPLEKPADEPCQRGAKKTERRKECTCALFFRSY